MGLGKFRDDPALVFAACNYIMPEMQAIRDVLRKHLEFIRPYDALPVSILEWIGE